MNKLLTLSAFFCLFLFSCNTSSSLKSSKEQQIAGKEELESLYKRLETGGKIKLKNQIYYLDRPLMISSKEDLVLDGNGCTFIMKNKNEDVLIVERSNNIILKNFKATHIEPEGPIGCTGSVIQVRENVGVLIEKCELNGSGIIGVMSYDTKDLKVVENYIYNNSDFGVLYNVNTTLEIKGNKFEDNGASGNDHVAKALNDFLSEVEKIDKDTNKEGLKMSDNTFK